MEKIELARKKTAFKIYCWSYKSGLHETAYMFNKFGLCLSNRRKIV